MLNREKWVQIKRGAEASIWKMELFGKKCVAKILEKKIWRPEPLDLELRKERIQNEIRTNKRCVWLGIPTSTLVFVDADNFIIVTEELTGGTIKEMIYNIDKYSEEKVSQYLMSVGKIISDLHNNGVIHSDLTTSNFMIHNDTVRVIDFGLSFPSETPESKAVDLYILERAFYSTHPGKDELLNIIFSSYYSNIHKAAEIRKKLDEVRQRGRKRSMAG